MSGETVPDDDPRYAAYAYLLLRGRLRSAAEIDLNPAVPLCGEIYHRRAGLAEGERPEDKPQVCVRPAGHRDRWDIWLDLIASPAPRRDILGDQGWHRGWQITPITRNDSWGKYGHCSMVW